MKAPFYRVFIDNDEKRELTEFIDQFKYEDCTEEDDMLEIRINPKLAKAFDEDKDLITGKMLTFEFGYMGIETSGFRKARITDVTVRYAEIISITVRALDKGTVMKKTTSNKVWKNISTKGIITEIASRYGMTAKCEIDGRTHKSLPQGHLSDFEFIQQLATKEKNGEYLVYVRDTEIRFEKRGVEKSSRRRYVYGEDNSGIISFEPRNAESTTSKDGISNTAVGMNPMTKKPVVAKKDRTDGSMMDDYVNVYDANGNKTGTKKKDPVNEPAKAPKDDVLGNMFGLGKMTVAPPIADPSELGNLAGGTTKKGAMSQETATLKLEGNPTLRANEVITMDGVFKKHKGNWLITKCTHEIGTSGFTTTFELEKNGKKVGSVKATGKVNKTVGSSKNEPAKKEVHIYDANANRISK